MQSYKYRKYKVHAYFKDHFGSLYKTIQCTLYKPKDHTEGFPMYYAFSTLQKRTVQQRPQVLTALTKILFVVCTIYIYWVFFFTLNTPHTSKPITLQNNNRDLLGDNIEQSKE